jgi:hypothetical protein
MYGQPLPPTVHPQPIQDYPIPQQQYDMYGQPIPHQAYPPTQHQTYSPTPTPTPTPTAVQVQVPIQNPVTPNILLNFANQIAGNDSTYPLVASTAVISQYPRSQQLLTDMSNQFGAHNVLPPPDWIINDEARILWLKSDANALIYFLYRRPKYTKHLEELVNGGCMSYKALGDGDQHSACNTCCAQVCCCTCLCCGWYSARRVWSFLNPDQLGKQATACTPCSSNGVAQRQDVLTRLKGMGVDVPDESECGSRCKLIFCNPCVVTQTEGIIEYYYAKRMGLTLNKTALSRYHSKVTQLSPKYANYLDSTRINPSHPNSRHNYIRIETKQVPNGRTANGNTKYKTVIVHVLTLNTREKVTTATPHTLVPWGWEYIRTDYAIDHHNVTWANVHQLSNVPVNTTVAQPLSM